MCRRDDHGRQRVVVVGGTSGMGLSTVRATAALGADAVAAGWRPLAQRDTITGVKHVEIEVTDESSVRSLFDRIGARPPRGDRLARIPRRILRPNPRPGGSITFVTCGAVVWAPVHGSMIAAAFAALEALTRALAVELGPLRVNTIRPGYTDSDMWSFLSPTERDDLRRHVAEAMPVSGWAPPRTSPTPWCS